MNIGVLHSSSPEYKINSQVDSIPRIIHQIWIGEKSPPPISIMKTWEEKNPSFLYILWNEAEFIKRNMTFLCQSKIDNIRQIDGKVDIIRLEILYKYGGIFVDADSVCVEPLDEDIFLKGAHRNIGKSGYDGFAVFENENCRRGLVSNAMMGFVPRHPLCKDILLHILNDPTIEAIMETTKAWYVVGPALLTRFLETGKYPSVFKYPSYIFNPRHFTGDTYRGHRKVFGYHLWGTTNLSYDSMNSFVLPADLTFPSALLRAPFGRSTEYKGILTESTADLSEERPKGAHMNTDPPSLLDPECYSVMVWSYNTERRYIRDCLDSIANQIGYFGIELVWINNGSNEIFTSELEDEIEYFRRTTRFTRVKYEKIEINVEYSTAVSCGVFLCSHPLIFRIDSSAQMVPYWMLHQSMYIKTHPDVKTLSEGMRVLLDGNKKEHL